MMRSEGAFLPAAGHDLFLPLYDPFTRLLGFDRARQALVEQAGLEPHHRALGRLLHSHRRLKDNAEARILDLMTAAGFRQAKQLREHATIVGRVAFYQASAPA